MTRRFSIPLVLVALAVAARAPMTRLTAQDSLARRVAAAGNGTVRFSFRPRAEVCGDGRTFIAERDSTRGGVNQYYGSTNSSFEDLTNGSLTGRCEAGNAYVVLTVAGREVTTAELFVGPARVPARTDLGLVESQEAADYLLTLARRGGDISSAAFLGAGIAQNVRTTPTLLRYARETGLDEEVRESALKWSGRAAVREGAATQVSETARAIALSGRDPADLRERAVRVLGELPGGGRAVRGIYASLDLPDLRERAIRVVGESHDAESVAWLRGVITNAQENMDVRARAIRVLAEETGDTRTLRQMYPQLESSELREQVVRSIGEHGARDDIEMLRTIFMDASEAHDVRDRAVRMIAELGFGSELQASFNRVGDQELRDRIIRVVAERGSRSDLDWVEGIARDPKVDSDLRDRAVRALADAQVPSERLSRLYDTVNDQDVQDRLLRIMGDRGDATALAKLNQVARSDGNPDLRERAARSLGQSGKREKK